MLVIFLSFFCGSQTKQMLKYIGNSFHSFSIDFCSYHALFNSKDGILIPSLFSIIFTASFCFPFYSLLTKYNISYVSDEYMLIVGTYCVIKQYVLSFFVVRICGVDTFFCAFLISTIYIWIQTTLKTQFLVLCVILYGLVPVIYTREYWEFWT